MLKSILVAIAFATFAWTATASTGTQNTQQARTGVKNVQLAQQGGVYCRKGTRWDQRQRTCVPE
jgi:hypothetical protein